MHIADICAISLTFQLCEKQRSWQGNGGKALAIRARLNPKFRAQPHSQIPAGLTQQFTHQTEIPVIRVLLQRFSKIKTNPLLPYQKFFLPYLDKDTVISMRLRACARGLSHDTFILVATHCAGLGLPSAPRRWLPLGTDRSDSPALRRCVVGGSTWSFRAGDLQAPAEPPTALLGAVAGAEAGWQVGSCTAEDDGCCALGAAHCLGVVVCTLYRNF